MVNTPRRQRLSLDGTWRFHVDGEAEPRGDIPVPLPWEVTYPDLRDRPVTATYTRTFTVPANWKGDIIRLIVLTLFPILALWLPSRMWRAGAAQFGLTEDWTGMKRSIVSQPDGSRSCWPSIPSRATSRSRRCPS